MVIVCGDMLVLLGAGHPLTEFPRGLQVRGRTADRIADQEGFFRADRVPPSGFDHDDERLLARDDPHFPPDLVQVHPAAVEVAPPSR